MNAPFLEIALGCVARGWYVFPCKPRAKEPLIRGGFHAATDSREQIAEWWSKWPDANVGIATGASMLTVLDIDTGIDDRDALEDFFERHDLPTTYLVRTGRRPGFGVQAYFNGGTLKSIPWSVGGVAGDVRSGSGYVMAAGSVHPSGERYEALVEAPVAFEPAFVRELRSAVSEKSLAGDEPIREHRNTALTSIAGKLRNAGLDAESLELALLSVNEKRCEPSLGESEVKRIAWNVGKYVVPAVAVTVGKPKETEPERSEPVDWREHYHTRLEMETTPPPVFLIDGFLLADSMTAIAAPVGQRKSIIALNVAHALCTGEPLFGYFPVTKRATRVLYLCPEMGIRSFTDRVRKIGLLNYVGETLFCRTMNKAEGLLPLVQLREEEVRGAVVIIDTVVRYLEGDENSSEHMRAFARTILRRASGRGNVTEA